MSLLKRSSLGEGIPAGISPDQLISFQHKTYLDCRTLWFLSFLQQVDVLSLFFLLLVRMMDFMCDRTHLPGNVICSLPFLKQLVLVVPPAD